MAKKQIIKNEHNISWNLPKTLITTSWIRCLGVVVLILAGGIFLVNTERLDTGNE